MKTKNQNTIKIFFFGTLIFGMGGFFFGAEPTLAATGINKQINFQGKVVNNDGTNVTTASYNFLFCIYTTASPVTPCTASDDNDAVWRESKGITVTDGIFQTSLGDTTTLPGSVDFNVDELYLGINFNSNGEMTPLVRFTAAPYAMNADKVGGLGTADLVVKAATENQTVTSSQTTGTVFGVTDTTELSDAIKGLDITLSGAGAFDQTGLEFNLSGASGTNLNDIVGSGSTWKVSTGGAATFASASAGSGTITTSGTIGTAATTTFTGAGATFSSAVSANGGITFDNSTDTLGAHTLGGTLDANTNIIQNIGNAGTNFIASTGALTLAGILTANGGISLSASQSMTAGALSYVDLGSIVHNSTTIQGLRLPQAASATPSNPTSGEGYLAWDAAGNQLITYNGSAWATVGGSQTPWASDISAAGYDLGSLSNLGFQETTSAPTGTDVGFYRDNTGDLTGNVLTGKMFNLAVNGSDEYNFSSSALAMNSNNITGLGTNLTATAGLTIATTTTGVLTLDSGTTGAINIGTGTSGKAIHIGDDDTTADTLTIGSAKDSLTLRGATLTIGNAADTAVSITDNNWSINTSGVASFITGSVIGSQTFTTNNIADSGALTISSAAGSDLTFKSANNGAGNSGNIVINVGTASGTAGTISIGTANTSAVSIGRNGVTTTNNGALTSTGLLTATSVNMPTDIGIDTNNVITSNGNGTANVAANTATFLNDVQTTYTQETIAANASLALTDNAANYIVADRDTNSWVVLASEDSIDYKRYLPYAEIYRSGNSLHIQMALLWGKALTGNIYHRFQDTERYAREDGLDGIAVAASSLAITVNGGTVWTAFTSHAIAAVTTATDWFNSHHESNVWVNSFNASDPVINNTQYDPGTNLATLDDGFWTINYLYRGIEADAQDHLYRVLGSAQYATLAEAKASNVIASLPVLISSHAMLIGRVIIQKNATSAGAIESAFTTIYAGSSAITSHASLTGLTNDDHMQYALLAGRSGGQSLTGGTGSGDTLTLTSTSNITKGAIQFFGSTTGSFASTGVLSLAGGNTTGDLTTLSTAAGTTLNILPSNPSSAGAGVGLVLKGSAGTTTGAGGAVTITAGAAAGAGTTGGTITLTTGAGGASGTAPSGGLTLVTGNAASGTAGTVSINTGTSSTGTGAVSIGTAARAQTISIGNNATTGTVTTIGSLTNTGLILQDAQWNVTDAGAATFASASAGSGTITTSGTIGTASTTTFTGAGATFSSAIAANGGITFDAGTDTIGAFTAGGTISMGAQALNGTTGVINYTGFDVDASGNLDVLGTINAGSGNIALTDATGNILHDALVVCADTQILKYATATAWGCAADATGGGGGTLQGAYDTASGNTILTTTARNIAFTLADVATPTEVTINNLDPSGTNALQIDNSTTLTNGLLVEQSVAGTMTNGLQVLGTAGTITNGLLIADGAGAITNGIQMTGTFTTTILDTPSIDISGAGAITGATGVSTTTVTASSAIAANGGITFDAGTDTIGAFTAGGTISMGAQALNGTTGVINYTNFDVDASGNVDIGGALTAGSGNTVVTDATGHVQHDSIVDCADTQILKWTTAGQWGCAADATGGGGGGDTTKYLSANQTSSSTTMAKVTGLDTTLAAGTWAFRYIAIYRSSATATAVKLGVNFSGTQTTFVTEATGGEATTAASTGVVDQVHAAFGLRSGGASRAPSATVSIFGPTAVDTANANMMAIINGLIVVTVSGNIQLYFGSEATGSTQTIMANSSLILTPITAGADLAEIYSTNDTSIGAGDVVSLDASLKAGVKKSEKAYDANVFGIIATSPGLVMGSLEDEGTVPVKVALAGRVPVKVTAENGPILPGDLLTASLIPGVAMKATKAGQVIGQAMIGFDGEGVGSVLAFIKTDHSNGAKLADIFPGLTEDGIETSSADIGKRALAQFISQKEQLATANLSEIVTDRLAAGLEIITPKVTTQELATDIIKPSLTNTLAIQIGANGEVTFGETGKTPTTTIDALGNATFAGVVTAKTIRADSIEGLEIYTDSVKSLEEKYAGLVPSSFVVTPSVTADTTILSATSEPASATALSQTLEIFSMKNLAVTLDASVLGKLTVSGALTMVGPAEFQGETLFRKLATFFGDALFKGKVAFEKTPTFSSNTAGFAVIGEGQKSVDIIFDEKYAKQPIVSVSLTSDQSPLLDSADKSLQKDIQAVEDDFNAAYFDGDIKYLVTKKSENGFTILLNKKAPREFQFSWVALAVSGAKVSHSKDMVVDTASASSADTQIDMTSETTVPSQGEIPPVSAEVSVESLVDATPVVPSTVNQTQTENTSPSVSNASSVVDQAVPVVETSIEEIAPITDSLSQLTNSLGQ